MVISMERRLKKLEESYANPGKRRVAMVVYDPSICPQCDLPSIEANVILCLLNNGHRTPKGKVVPCEGYLIRCSINQR